MHRFRDPEQDRSERHAAARGDLQQIERDVGGVRRRHDQQIRLALQPRERERTHPHFLVQRRVTVHLAFDLELGIHPVDESNALGSSPVPALFRSVPDRVPPEGLIPLPASALAPTTDLAQPRT